MAKMGNSLDSDGRGPTNGQLLAAGTGVIVVTALIITSLLFKATGRLDDYVRVVADLTNVGDGLPKSSDVKFRGLLVGSVNDVTPAAFGKPNFVHIDLKPEYAKSIPNTVTARVVPSNVFAVSSVQLVDPADNRGGRAVRDGDHVLEDTELSTVIFQTTINKLRDILTATGRGRDDHTQGILAAVGMATENRRVKLLNAGGQMTRLLDQLNDIVATDPGPSTLSALLAATEGLQATAPELVDALHQAVKPMQTFAEKREQLTSLIGGSQHTLGVSRQALDNHTDQMIEMTHDFTPVLGVLAINSDQFVPIFTRLKRLSDKFFEQAWIPDADIPNLRVNLSVTPSFTYTRADCPQYGQLKGPSCFTAPEISVRPDLPDVLLPQNYRFPPGLEPPPGTAIGPDGNLIAVGPPLLNPIPTNLNDPAWTPPLPWWTGPAPRVPSTADPADAGPPPPPSPPIPPGPVAPEWQPAAPPGAAPAGTAAYGGKVGTAAYGGNVGTAAYGGNVGPVGSQQERNQLGLITGQREPASVATQLLLGPVARGTSVAIVPAAAAPAARPGPAK